MNTLHILDALQQSWTQSLTKLIPTLDAEVTPAAADRLLKQLVETLRTVVLHTFTLWLQKAECHDQQFQRDGVWYRFKFASRREFLTPVGPITLERRLFQTDNCQHSCVPMDEAWGMVGQYAMAPVREAVTLMMGLMIAGEAATVLNKVSLFQVGETTMKQLAGEFGAWLEANPKIVAEVRATEAVPPETKVLAASMDGSNVRLNEKGPKPGRPAQGDAGELDPTCFKNAMVGTVSFYGAVPEGEATPERLHTVYTSHMPEAGCGTFRREFEAELTDTLAKIDPAIAKVLVMDGAKSLWGYVESKPVYAGLSAINT